MTALDDVRIGGGAGMRTLVRGTLSGMLQRWALFAVLVALWELAARSADSVFFPPPSTIGSTGVDLWLSGPAYRLFLGDAVFDQVLPSVGRVLGGWAIAGVLGVGLGLVLGRSTTGMACVGWLLNFLRAIPPPLLVPFFLVTLGLGSMQIGTIVFGALWPVLLNTVDGARSVDAVKADTAAVFRLSKAQWLLGVVLPVALPKVFAGLRVSLSLALILMVVSELVGSLGGGIGVSLVRAQRDYDLPPMWAWIVLLGILGYLFNALLLVVERRVLTWQPGRGSVLAATGRA